MKKVNKIESIAITALDKLAEQTPVKGKWKAGAQGETDGLLQLNYNKKNYLFNGQLKEILRHDHVAGLEKKAKATFTGSGCQYTEGCKESASGKTDQLY